MLREAAAVGADLLRTGHQPADPTTLMLADRLGFAVWEEIPLYHATPLVFERTMARGIPQQMVREMALRDMNRPSVLFHGFANESGGDEERTDALRELHEVDRAIDGTRLTGQAAYGWAPDDPTHAPLDVAGFTFYHGVFYGEDPATDTGPALVAARNANPGKPIMILEFGRWADTAERRGAPAGDLRGHLHGRSSDLRGDEPAGFVAAATWWTLRDFATQIAGIGVEDFGLYRPDGSLRPAGELAAEAFLAPAGRGDALALEPDLDRPRVRQPSLVGDWSLAVYLAYAIVFSMGSLARGAAGPHAPRWTRGGVDTVRLVRGRLAAVSVRASFGAGAWVGGALGLVIGAVLGAILAWFAGTLLEWQRDLAFTLGVARALLPLGDQVGALRWISSTWYAVIPVVRASCSRSSPAWSAG